MGTGVTLCLRVSQSYILKPNLNHGTHKWDCSTCSLKLKQQSNKKNVLNQPLFIDILIRDEEKSGWKSDIRPLPIKD